MRYMLLIYGDEATWASATEDDRNRLVGEYMTFGEAITNEGIMRGGDALQPVSTATTVRVRGGEALATDGPFAETREQLGGFYMVDCGTLDQAIDAARRVPGARTGSVEVRPIMEFT